MSKKTRFQTVSCHVNPDWVSQEEWGRVSSYMSWPASSLRPQKLACNLDSKWSPAGWWPKQTVHFDAYMYVFLSAPLSVTLVVFRFILNWNLLHFFHFPSSRFTWNLFTCIFLWPVRTCVCWTVFLCEVIQYYKQLYVTVLRTFVALNKKDWFNHF